MSDLDLDKMSDADLARWQAGWKQESDKYILADREWSRRQMERQHQLNLQLLEKQKDMNRLSIVATVTATIIGAVLGALLTVLF